MRKTDDTPTEYLRRPDRIECVEGCWYVRTREGRRGPFGSRRAAEAERALYVDTMSYLERADTLLAGLDGVDVELVHFDRLPWS